MPRAKQKQAEDPAVLAWLLEGDPAIRWQALRDLALAGRVEVERERGQVEHSGWGARLLSLQAREGTWGSGLYNPKWTSTFYTLLLLRDFGLAPASAAAIKACSLLLERGLRPDGGVNYGPAARSETCVTGMALSLACYFEQLGGRVDGIVGHLLEQQMSDGGWNCRRARGATHSSVHTTISVLEGLRLYELACTKQRAKVRAAQERAREFLLVHRLFRSHRTGRIMKSEFTRLVFPPRWHYDILRALDHFRSVSASFDPRLEEAVEFLKSKRAADGRWPLEYAYRGESHFQLERVGAASRWNTLRALRVLAWWEGVVPASDR